MNIADDTPNAAAIVEGRYDIKILDQALAEKPNRMRYLFSAAMVNHKPYSEIASRAWRERADGLNRSQQCVFLGEGTASQHVKLLSDHPVECCQISTYGICSSPQRLRFLPDVLDDLRNVCRQSVMIEH